MIPPCRVDQNITRRQFLLDDECRLFHSSFVQHITRNSHSHTAGRPNRIYHDLCFLRRPVHNGDFCSSIRQRPGKSAAQHTAAASDYRHFILQLPVHPSIAPSLFHNSCFPPLWLYSNSSCTIAADAAKTSSSSGSDFCKNTFSRSYNKSNRCNVLAKP